MVVATSPAESTKPLDVEKDLATYTPPADVPDREQVRSALTVPDVPEAMPAVPTLLERLASAALDPWGYELPRMEQSAPSSNQDLTP